MSALPHVSALVFDVFGTVVDWRSGVARDVGRMLAKHDRGDIHPLHFSDAWRRGYQPAMEEVRSGRRPFARLDVLHREILDRVLQAHGMALPEADAAWLNRAWHRLDPWPDAVPGLLRLRTRHFIAPLSNGNIRLLADMAKRAAIPWDAILGAEAAGAYKPEPAAYLNTAAILGLEPAQVALVAAHNNDLEAARSCGFATAFVPRIEHGPGQTTDLGATGAWDVIASDFEDLASRFDC